MQVTVAGTTLHLSRLTVVLALVCLVFIGYSGYDYVEQTRVVDRAEDVDATVVKVGVEETTARRGVSYYPVVEYEYRYGGTTYTGEDVFPGSIEPSYDTESEARRVVAPYDEGETTTAYVDPYQPDDAFLKDTTTNAPVWLGGLFSVVLALTVLNAVGPRNPGRAEPKPAEEVSDQRYGTVLGVDRGKVHRHTKRLATLSAVALPVSLVAEVLVLLSIFGLEGDPSVQADPLGPFGLPLIVAFIALVTFTASLFGYTVWSFTEYRRLRDRIEPPKPPSPFRHPSRLVTILGADSGELSEYGERVRLTGAAVVVCLGLVALFLRTVPGA